MLLQVEEGSLYPAMQRLLKKARHSRVDGVALDNRRVCVYEITRAGLSHLEQEISSFDRMQEIHPDGTWAYEGHREFFLGGSVR